MRRPCSNCAIWLTVRGSNPGRGKDASSRTSRPVLGPTYSHIKWVQVPFPDIRGVKLTARVHLVLRLRMSGDIPPLLLCAFMVLTRKTTRLRLHFTFSWATNTVMVGSVSCSFFFMGKHKHCFSLRTFPVLCYLTYTPKPRLWPSVAVIKAPSVNFLTQACCISCNLMVKDLLVIIQAEFYDEEK
jgi:hypothetical protein